VKSRFAYSTIIDSCIITPFVFCSVQRAKIPHVLDSSIWIYTKRGGFVVVEVVVELWTGVGLRECGAIVIFVLGCLFENAT
jgi:hypothetical protein